MSNLTQERLTEMQQEFAINVGLDINFFQSTNPVSRFVSYIRNKIS